MPEITKLVFCQNGYHLCRINDTIRWMRSYSEVYEAEYSGKLITSHGQILVQRARLIRNVTEEIIQYFADLGIRVFTENPWYYEESDRQEKYLLSIK